MEAIIGKWKVDLDETQGLQEYGKVFGFTDQMIEAFKRTSYTIEWSKAGDKWQATLNMDNFPSNVYSYTLGEGITYHAPDGSNPQLTVTLDGDKVVEDYVEKDSGKAWRTIRQLADPSTMKVTTTFQGTSVHQILRKQ